MAWFAEGRWLGPKGEVGEWQRLGGPYKTQERAKAECADELKFAANKRAEFRTVADDERGTVYQISVPPHAWRLRWVNGAYPPLSPANAGVGRLVNEGKKGGQRWRE